MTIDIIIECKKKHSYIYIYKIFKETKYLVMKKSKNKDYQ